MTDHFAVGIVPHGPIWEAYCSCGAFWRSADPDEARSSRDEHIADAFDTRGVCG